MKYVSFRHQGGSARRTPAVWMKPGDIVEVQIGHIGTLVNRIVGEESLGAAMMTGDKYARSATPRSET